MYSGAAPACAASALTLTVTQANAHAAEFYKKLGFSVTRVSMPFVGKANQVVSGCSFDSVILAVTLGRFLDAGDRLLEVRRKHHGMKLDVSVQR